MKALGRDEVWDCGRPLLVGDADVLLHAASLVGSPFRFRSIDDPGAARYDRTMPDLLNLDNVDYAALEKGAVSERSGRASVDYIERAVELVQAGQAHALVTNPINKAALKDAGVPFIGHTELLASMTGEPEVTTMLATTGLQVVHVTRHVPMKQVASLITKERVLKTIHLTDVGLKDMGYPQPRLAVAALNPHGGDEGLMGREELDAIGPAVEVARVAGIDATGPIPADSVFFRAIRGEFDAVVAMYHDQGHIPIKTHGFERSVTVTLGLPIVRTSVDHGTAFDIAWQGIAHEESLVEAIKLAATMVEHRRTR